MSLYPQYQNEDDFRKRFVLPLLNRLGFFGVAEKHGSREFGKDFVFSELHRFGGVRHYAAQVKHEEKINQGQVVDGLLSQIRQAFSLPFTLSDSPRERYISACYVFNSGAITQNAEDYILAELRRERYGDNVHFLDGGRLDSLNRWSTYQTDQAVRQRLVGLRNQLILNIKIWTSIVATQQSAEPLKDCRPSLLHAIEEFMSSPICSDDIVPDDLAMVWQGAKIIDSTNQCLFDLSIAKVCRDRDIASLSEMASRMTPVARRIIQGVERALARLSPVV